MYEIKFISYIYALLRHYSVPRTWESMGTCIYTYSTGHSLTPPSSSRSPSLEGGVSSTYAACPRCISIIITHALYFEIYTTLLEVIQLMSIAGYEAYVFVCFFMYKTCAAFIWLPWDARSCPYVCLYCGEKNLNT